MQVMMQVCGLPLPAPQIGRRCWLMTHSSPRQQLLLEDHSPPSRLKLLCHPASFPHPNVHHTIHTRVPRAHPRAPPPLQVQVELLGRGLGPDPAHPVPQRELGGGVRAAEPEQVHAEGRHAQHVARGG